MFENLDIPLDELLPSDGLLEVVKIAVEIKVKEFCKEKKIDFDKVDYEYGASVSINIFGDKLFKKLRPDRG